jgi:hypothetical protein
MADDDNDGEVPTNTRKSGLHTFPLDRVSLGVCMWLLGIHPCYKRLPPLLLRQCKRVCFPDMICDAISLSAIFFHIYAVTICFILLTIHSKRATCI